MAGAHDDYLSVKKSVFAEFTAQVVAANSASSRDKVKSVRSESRSRTDLYSDSDTLTEYEFAALIFATESLSFDGAMRLRAYAGERTNFNGFAYEQSGRETVWMSLFNGMTHQLEEAFPDEMRLAEEHEALKRVLEKTVERSKLSQPKWDYWGILVAGGIVGAIVVLALWLIKSS